MVITLIGYRGSGKSTVAPLLARALGCDWTDADLVIEERAGCTIRETFAQEGEPGFRERERDVIRELLGRESLVLAAGGGAILNPETRYHMRAAGPVVWLKAPIDILAARIAGDGATGDRRPNLAGGGIDEIRRMLTLREPLYRECATLEIDVGERTPADVAHEILRHLNRQTPGESA